MEAKILTILMALVVALGVLGFVQAPTAFAAVGNGSYKGQITSYDCAAKQMVISGEDGERPFFVGNARIVGTINLKENVLVTYSDGS